MSGADGRMCLANQANNLYAGWLPAAKRVWRKCTVQSAHLGRTSVFVMHADAGINRRIFPDHVVKLSILHWRDTNIPLRL